jgi:hypothetical protein
VSDIYEEVVSWEKGFRVKGVRRKGEISMMN